MPSTVCATAQAAQSIRRPHIAFRMIEGRRPYRPKLLASERLHRTDGAELMVLIAGTVAHPCQSDMLPSRWLWISIASLRHEHGEDRHAVASVVGCIRSRMRAALCALPRPARKLQDQSRMVARFNAFFEQEARVIVSWSDAPLGRSRSRPRRDPWAASRPRPKRSKLFRFDLL